MNLMYLAALIAVCSAAKLDRTYLPPASAKTAGGSPGDIQTPFARDVFNPGQTALPKGAFDNEFDGVVVEAAAPGTRVSSSGETGLGADRISYGTIHSKVGGAAFKTNQQGFNIANPQDSKSHTDKIESQTLNFQQVANFELNTARPQAEFEKASNIIRFENNASPQAYNYAFETDNGITAEENGVAVNGIQAEGGYSYTGDDGKFYKVTYTAGEGGYQPSGDHLPTPPPIPEEILKSLEQNAKEAAEGIVDDGSYDAAKYNAEDDRTKSDSNNEGYNGGQSFGSTPESDARVSGTFIDQNTRVFENLNGSQKLPSTTLNDDMNGNNVLGFIQNNLQPKPIFAAGLGNQPSSTGEPFDKNNDEHATNGFGTSESDKKESTDQNNFSVNDDYSRPIYFGSSHLNQGTNNRFGLQQQSYLPPTYKHDYNNRQSVYTAQNNLESSTFGSRAPSNNVNKSLISGQSRPQFFANTQLNQYSHNYNSQLPQGQFINGQFSKNGNKNGQSDIQASYNTFNNIHSTLQPSAELTTPFEDFPNSNKQSSTDNVPLIPTQASFSDLTGPKSQSNNVPQINFGTSNKDFSNNKFKVNTAVSQQSFEQFSSEYFMKLSGNSQNQGPDNSYYYNLPSKPFSSDRITQTFVPENSPFNSGSQNGAMTRYPKPPTVAPTVVSSLSNSMYNQYSNTNQASSFASRNDRFRPSTKYPQPPVVVTQNLPSTTSQTERDGNKYPEQYTGITQASVSPFPSTSTKYTSSVSNTQQSENSGHTQNLSQNLQINTFNAFQNETIPTNSFNRGQKNSYSSGQVVQQTPNKVEPETGNNAPQLVLNQQYNSEIYEYNKPAESLLTPTEADEDTSSMSTNDFSRFGQKLRPSSPIQSFTQTDINRGHQQENQPTTGTKPQLESTNFQGQFNQNKYTQNLLSTSDLINQGFNNNIKQQTQPANNLQPIDFKPTVETMKLASGAFVESQQTTDYKGPLGFSSRIRPCCQGPRTTEKDIRKDFGKPIRPVQDQAMHNSGISAQPGHQNNNQEPGLVNESSFNTPPIGFRPQTLHGTQAASQSLPAGIGEVFGGPRKPPSFDEISGYHY